MKKSILSFFLFGAILSAAPVNVSLVNVGQPADLVNGVYVGPYTLNVGGKIDPAMCMDNSLHSSVGSSWQANVTSLSGSNFSNTYLGNQTFNVSGQTYTSKDVYTAEAYLFSEIAAPKADRADIQEAAWDIMNPTTLAQDYYAGDTKAIGYLEDAFSNDKNFNTAGYEIISDVANCNQNQEFMVGPTATPEPATFALLGGGLFAAGAARLFRRKKQVEVKA